MQAATQNRLMTGANTRPATRVSDRVLFWGLGAVLIVISLAMVGLVRYKGQAGVANGAPARWPAPSRIELIPGQPTLALFAHPKCPCTRASLAELRVLTTFLVCIPVHGASCPTEMAA